ARHGPNRAESARWRPAGSGPSRFYRRPQRQARAERTSGSGASSPLLGRSRGRHRASGAEIRERLRGVLDPFLRVWTARRMRQERFQVLGGAVKVAALQQEKREAVVRAGERRVELERAAVMTDRFVVAARLGERDRHVLENARVVGKIAQCQAIGRQGRIIIPLTFQG